MSTPAPDGNGPGPLQDFRTIFEQEFSYVCRILRRLGVASADLEDVAQEVFLSVHRKFAEYDPARAIRPWLFAFAYRSASNHQRLARHRREVGGHDLPEPESTNTPESALRQRQSQTLVLNALQSVALERRSALIMYDIDGFTAPQIAEVLSIPVNTVYSRVRLARNEFKQALRRVQLQGGGHEL